MDHRSYRLYEQGAGSGRRIVKLITRVEGERMVRSKTAEAGLDWDGETLCFQRIDASASAAVPVYVPPSRTGLTGLETPETAFTLPEMNAIAGTKFKHGRSRTARLSDAQRKERRDRYGIPLPAEDLVERANNKIRAWEQLPVLMDRFRVVAAL